MFRSSNSLLAVLLALSLLFSRAHALFDKKIVIGFAALDSEQVDDIEDDDNLDKSPSSTGPLGSGLYLEDSPEKVVAPQGTRYCAVSAKQEEVAEAGKVYIPQSYQRKTLRGHTEKVMLEGNDRAINNYIEHVAKIDDEDEALRFTSVSEDEDMQMLVPNKVLDDGELDLETNCFNSVEELKQFSPAQVQWTNWGIVKASSN